MRKWVSELGLIFLALLLSISSVNGLAYPNNVVGQDISWPNCNHLKFDPTAFGIVGVNGGLDFHPNPCLGGEAALYKNNLSLYLNTGFPGEPYDLKYQFWPLNCSLNDVSCMAYNYGYNAGKYASNYALSRGIVSNNWWLDVEVVNSWLTNTSYNRSSLIGEVDAINQSVKPDFIGFYTYPSEWVTITGKWQNKLPNWVATDSNYKKVAENQCDGYGFNGGKTLLTQYVGKLDLDLAC